MLSHEFNCCWCVIEDFGYNFHYRWKSEGHDESNATFFDQKKGCKGIAVILHVLRSLFVLVSTTSSWQLPLPSQLVGNWQGIWWTTIIWGVARWQAVYVNVQELRS